MFELSQRFAITFLFQHCRSYLSTPTLGKERLLHQPRGVVQIRRQEPAAIKSAQDRVVDDVSGHPRSLSRLVCDLAQPCTFRTYSRRRHGQHDSKFCSVMTEATASVFSRMVFRTVFDEEPHIRIVAMRVAKASKVAAATEGQSASKKRRV